MEQRNPDLFTELTFDQQAKEHIRSIATWAMTIVVVAVISYGITIIEVLNRNGIDIRRSEGFDIKDVVMNQSVSGVLISVGLGLLINFFLFRFATLAKSAVNGLDQRKLISGFNNLKVYFIILSVIMIIFFVFILLAVVYSATRTV